jgi:hypothetical protein
MNGLIEEAISRHLLVGAEEKQDTSFRRASLWDKILKQDIQK